MNLDLINKKIKFWHIISIVLFVCMMCTLCVPVLAIITIIILAINGIITEPININLNSLSWSILATGCIMIPFFLTLFKVNFLKINRSELLKSLNGADI